MSKQCYNLYLIGNYKSETNERIFHLLNKLFIFKFVVLQIPNPLFDLAGITCGHFLVPFWTFFGATLIGKAVIKMMIQQVFVIVAFNEALIAKAVEAMSFIPFFGKRLQEPVTQFFTKQKERFHRKGPVMENNVSNMRLHF